MPGGSKVVCIVGPGRSGTSLLAKTLHCAGVDLGADASLARPRPHNLAGDWEHQGFVAFNEKILRRLSCNVNIPPDPRLVASWLSDPSFDSLKDEARKFIDEEFAGSALWGWKSPMTTLVLPFWQSILPQMRYILALRNPVDMVASHGKMNGYPPRRSYAIFFSYVFAALLHTEGAPRLITFYEDLLDNFDDEFCAIREFLQIDPSACSIEKVRDAVRRDLRHQHTTVDEMLLSSEVPPLLKSLYTLLYASVQMRKRGSRESMVLQEKVLSLVPALLFQEGQAKEPRLARIWRRAVRSAPARIRNTEYFYALNRLIEVLSQVGAAQLGRQTIERIVGLVDRARQSALSS